MTALNVFLRNLVVILVVGGVGYAVLSLPFDPLLTAGGYAGLLALVMTWFELSQAEVSGAPTRSRQVKAKKPRPRRQGAAKEKSSAMAEGTVAPASSASPAAAVGSAPPPTKRRTKKPGGAPPKAGHEGAQS